MSVTHHNALNEFVEGRNGVRYAFRRFGKVGGAPLLCLMHFRGNMDSWDPALIDALAAEREIILFDNTGVALTRGHTPDTILQMAKDALIFTDAMNLKKADVFGFSLGGFIAQEIALIRPDFVNKLILAGTGPRGGAGMHGWEKSIRDACMKPEQGLDEVLKIFFKQTPTSQEAGMAFAGRFLTRQTERDEWCTPQTYFAHYDAVCEWGVEDHNALNRLRSISAPTFCAQGDQDLMIPTKLTHLMAGLIPNAQVKIYPDSAHGFLWQHNTEFAADVNYFLGA